MGRVFLVRFSPDDTFNSYTNIKYCISTNVNEVRSMSRQNQLKKFIEQHDGIVTTKLVEEYHFNREQLHSLVREGDLERVAYGVYTTLGVWEDPLLILQLRRNKVIYSHETALFLHDLIDRDPIQYVVTVPHGYNSNTLKKEGLKIHSIKKDLFELGTCSKETMFGNSVKTYDMERTMCDIVRDRNNQDPALISKALKNYVKNSNKDLNKLMVYAKVLRVEKIMRTYLEVLL